MNDELIRIKKQEMEFLSYFRNRGYDLIDLNVIESYAWASLSGDDLKAMAKRHTWTEGGRVHALRSDWTNSVVQYRKRYELDAKKIAYSGPVYKKAGMVHQLGVETFTAEIESQMKVLEDVMGFISGPLNQQMSIAVISHNKLLKKLLTRDELMDPCVRDFLQERNRDALVHILKEGHPLLGLMEQRPENQVAYLREKLPELNDELDDVDLWTEKLKSLDIDHVYVDTLALPSQSYYRGIFIRLYRNNQTDPVASGGQYTSSSKAFGIAING